MKFKMRVKIRLMLLSLFIICQIVFIYYVIIMPIFYGPNNFRLSAKDGELLYSVDLEKCSRSNIDNYTSKLCEDMIGSNNLINNMQKDWFGKEPLGFGTYRIDEYKIKGGCYSCWFSKYLWIRSGSNYYPTFLYIPSVFSSKPQSIKVHQGKYGTQFRFFGKGGFAFGIFNIILIIMNILLSYKAIRFLIKNPNHSKLWGIF